MFSTPDVRVQTLPGHVPRCQPVAHPGARGRRGNHTGPAPAGGRAGQLTRQMGGPGIPGRVRS